MREQVHLAAGLVMEAENSVVVLLQGGDRHVLREDICRLDGGVTAETEAEHLDTEQCRRQQTAATSSTLRCVGSAPLAS